MPKILKVTSNSGICQTSSPVIFNLFLYGNLRPNVIWHTKDFVIKMFGVKIGTIEDYGTIIFKNCWGPGSIPNILLFKMFGVHLGPCFFLHETGGNGGLAYQTFCYSNVWCRFFFVFELLMSCIEIQRFQWNCSILFFVLFPFCCIFRCIEIQRFQWKWFIFLFFVVFPFCCFFRCIEIQRFQWNCSIFFVFRSFSFLLYFQVHWNLWISMKMINFFCVSFFFLFVVFSGALKSRDFNETVPFFLLFVLFPFCCFFRFIEIQRFQWNWSIFFCFSFFFLFVVFSGALKSRDFNATDPFFCFSFFFLFVVFSGSLKSLHFNENDQFFLCFVFSLFVVFSGALKSRDFNKTVPFFLLFVLFPFCCFFRFIEIQRFQWNWSIFFVFRSFSFLLFFQVHWNPEISMQLIHFFVFLFFSFLLFIQVHWNPEVSMKLINFFVFLFFSVFFGVVFSGSLKSRDFNETCLPILFVFLVFPFCFFAGPLFWFFVFFLFVVFSGSLQSWISMKLLIQDCPFLSMIFSFWEFSSFQWRWKCLDFVASKSLICQTSSPVIFNLFPTEKDIYLQKLLGTKEYIPNILLIKMFGVAFGPMFFPSRNWWQRRFGVPNILLFKCLVSNFFCLWTVDELHWNPEISIKPFHFLFFVIFPFCCIFRCIEIQRFQWNCSIFFVVRSFSFLLFFQVHWNLWISMKLIHFFVFLFFSFFLFFQVHWNPEISMKLIQFFVVSFFFLFVVFSGAFFLGWCWICIHFSDKEIWVQTCFSFFL